MCILKIFEWLPWQRELEIDQKQGKMVIFVILCDT